MDLITKFDVNNCINNNVNSSKRSVDVTSYEVYCFFIVVCLLDRSASRENGNAQTTKAVSQQSKGTESHHNKTKKEKQRKAKLSPKHKAKLQIVSYLQYTISLGLRICRTHRLNRTDLYRNLNRKIETMFLPMLYRYSRCSVYWP